MPGQTESQCDVLPLFENLRQEDTLLLGCTITARGTAQSVQRLNQLATDL